MVYIIIRGPLGCGKSTISKRLVGELKADYISIDKVLEDLSLDKMDKKEGSIPARNFIKANESVLERVKSDLEGGRVVIFDGCFYHKEQIEHLEKNLSGKHYVFDLKAPVKLCIERDSGRNKTYGEGAARAVHKMVSRFDYGIPINVNKPLDKVIRQIKRHVG